MSWLLFLDESGYDHRTMPYEVRGGIAMHAKELWPFVQAVQRLELAAFGTTLHQFGKELKGCKLLDRDRFKWAAQGPAMSDEERRKHCRAFLTKGLEKRPPSQIEFTAYGQACLEMARGIFQLMRDHGAQLFASLIPADALKPDSYEVTEFLRKDHVFLLERFYYFLESRQEHGLLIMDEVEKSEDRRHAHRLQRYFTKTISGRYRAKWIVPAPFFVSSDLTYPIQAADTAIYCLNWGFRLPAKGLNAPVRAEIATEFGPWLTQLQFRGETFKDGLTFSEFGIVYVPDPYSASMTNKKEATLLQPPESSSSAQPPLL